MAGPSTWRFNPMQGLFEQASPSGDIRQASYQELSNEAYELTPGGQLVSLGGGPFYQQGTSGDIIYQQYSNGYGELQSQMSSRPRNLYTAENATYGVSGVLHVNLPSGAARSVSIEMADLYGMGQRVYAYTGSTGETEYVALQPGSGEMFAAQAAAGPTWHQASTDETIEYALRGYLAKNERQLLEEWAGEAGVGQNPEARDARYDAARQIAQLTLQSVTLFKTHLAGFSGR